MARQIRRIATTSAALVAVGAGALSLAGPALADPSGYRQYNGVGSDTTQSVVDALAGDGPTASDGVTTLVGSWDAYGPGGSALSAQIQTTQNGPAFDRPLGSGAGIKALSDALTGTPYGTGGVNIAGQVDFARSSSGPATSGNALTYVPFARDAVSYLYTGAANKVGKLTTAQLNQIYTANGSPAVINGVAITGVLPQSNSGTRKFFLAAIGVTTVGSAVAQTTNAENDGGILDGRVNSVVPFSAAQFVAQKNDVVPDSTESYGYGAPNGKPAVTLKNGTYLPVTAFYNAAPYGRNVYNVIATTEVNGTGVGKLFVGKKAPFCSQKALSTAVKYGFAKLAASGSIPACGTTGITGPYTP